DDNRSVCSRWRYRCFCPHRGRLHVAHARTAVHHRECAWGRRYDRLNPWNARKADGYTILMGHIGTHAFSASLYPNLAYKPDVDFEPIGVAVEMPEFIVARKDFPANDLKEFITYVKANAENLNMAHAGVGSITFTFGLLLNSLLGVKPTTVPFSGVAPATAALLGAKSTT